MILQFSVMERDCSVTQVTCLEVEYYRVLRFKQKQKTIFKINFKVQKEKQENSCGIFILV